MPIPISRDEDFRPAIKKIMEELGLINNNVKQMANKVELINSDVSLLLRNKEKKDKRQ